jgi:hypothetical protein
MNIWVPKLSILKFILLIMSFLGICAVGIGIAYKIESQNGEASLAGEIIVLCLLVLTGISGFIAQAYPKILWVPTIVFFLLGMIETGFIVSGMTGPSAAQVPLWHAGILFFFMTLLPVWLAWACLKAMRHL